jgi:hypothetical protein
MLNSFPTPVYCDMKSDEYPWTLVESFSLEKNSYFQKKSFQNNFAQNHPGNLENYRLPFNEMYALSGISTRWRATCNLGNKLFISHSTY